MIQDSNRTLDSSVQAFTNLDLVEGVRELGGLLGRGGAPTASAPARSAAPPAPGHVDGPVRPAGAPAASAAGSRSPAGAVR